VHGEIAVMSLLCTVFVPVFAHHLLLLVPKNKTGTGQSQWQ
jgi:hypothetical protein